MNVTLKLTKQQADWLLYMLTYGHDGFFEDNPKERRTNDAIAKKLNKATGSKSQYLG